MNNSIKIKRKTYKAVVDRGRNMCAMAALLYDTKHKFYAVVFSWVVKNPTDDQNFTTDRIQKVLLGRIMKRFDKPLAGISTNLMRLTDIILFNRVGNIITESVLNEMLDAYVEKHADDILRRLKLKIKRTEAQKVWETAKVRDTKIDENLQPKLIQTKDGPGYVTTDSV